MTSSAVGRRLAELATQHALPDGAAERLWMLLDLVATDHTAPTTVREPAQAVEAHVADSLAALDLPAVRAATAIADLGAGAGFPGIPLAIGLPDADVSLIEAASRKCAFLERATEAARCPRAVVVCARAEAWPEGIAAHDVVTARAVAPLAVLVEYAAPLLREGGVLVAWKGVRDAAEEADANAAAAVTGLEPADVVVVPPFPGADHRHLYLYSKVRETPPRFPRRPGMARKRPLRANT